MSGGASSAFHAAKIIGRRVVSPTVVVLDLEATTCTSSGGGSFQFQPGQWIDFVVPPYEWVGGFSPANLPSTPSNSSQVQVVTIAVKRSNHPPSLWVHSDESKEIGRGCQIRAGGNCVLDTNSAIQQKNPVVFIAGGIGISPLLSMYRQWTQLVQQQQQQSEQEEESQRISTPKSSFLYSVSTEDELVFGEELVQMAVTKSTEKQQQQQQQPQHELIFTLTQQPKGWSTELETKLQSQGIQCRTGRASFLIFANFRNTSTACSSDNLSTLASIAALANADLINRNVANVVVSFAFIAVFI